jgi:hypothetical protein
MVLTSFEFVLNLHLMKLVMGFTNSLCQALQQNSEDILDAMTVVSTIKLLIQKLRNEEWKPFLTLLSHFVKEMKLKFLI